MSLRMGVSAALCAGLSTCWPPASLGTESESSALKTATKEQYFACLDASDTIEARRAKLMEQETAHKALDARFQAAEADLAAQVKRHAPSTPSEIQSYNRAIGRRNASAERLNRESLSLQLEQRALNDFITATNSLCSGLLVSDELVQAASERRRGTAPGTGAVKASPQR